MFAGLGCGKNHFWGRQAKPNPSACPKTWNAPCHAPHCIRAFDRERHFMELVTAFGIRGGFGDSLVVCPPRCQVHAGARDRLAGEVEGPARHGDRVGICLVYRLRSVLRPEDSSGRGCGRWLLTAWAAALSRLAARAASDGPG